MRLALYQPDIPQNVGAALRMGACLGIGVDVIGPCGFPFSDKALRRAGMDYVAHADVIQHVHWKAFLETRTTRPDGGRLVLLTTRASQPFTEFVFHGDDTLLLGRESAGVPDEVHGAADALVVIPLMPGRRSLNVTVAAAMVLSEALSQTGGWPPVERSASERSAEAGGHKNREGRSDDRDAAPCHEDQLS
ncbi:MAG: tRNA (cytidine(34)-2'-O)-methyltransferase [Alphaproteobacteria bacterium]